MNLSLGFQSRPRLRRSMARAVVCALAMTLPSCQIPCLRTAAPAPPLPGDFNGKSSTENSAQLGYDEFYNDQTLAALIREALAGNRELKNLDEEVQIASNEILARRGAYQPTVGFGAGIGLDKSSRYTPIGAAERNLEFVPGKEFPDPLPDFRGSFNFLWPLDIWREFRNARDAAIQRYHAAIDKRAYFVTNLISEVAEKYFELMSLDKRMETLDATIDLQQRSLDMAKIKKEAARGTELAVQRFQAEVRKNQSEKLIVRQDVVEVENRINQLLNRFSTQVDRKSAAFLDVELRALQVGVPSQLLLNRPDIRQAEREIQASGLEVLVARAHFYPRVDITASIGYQAFNPRYLLNTPEALIGNLAGDLVVPVINRKAIQAEYMTANARQLQAIYDYQKTVLTAFTEVVNRMSRVENYRKSIDFKKQQLKSLEESVESSTRLFQNARIEYIEVLFAQRDMLEARMSLIEAKRQQLAAAVKAYQALGGGDPSRQPANTTVVADGGATVNVQPLPAAASTPAGPAAAKTPDAPAPTSAPAGSSANRQPATPILKDPPAPAVPEKLVPRPTPAPAPPPKPVEGGRKPLFEG